MNSSHYQASDEEVNAAVLEEFEERFVKEMDDDFNAANGITVVYELAKWLNLGEETDLALAAGLAKFSEWLTIFGMYFVSEELLDEEIEQLINERIAAKPKILPAATKSVMS